MRSKQSYVRDRRGRASEQKKCPHNYLMRLEPRSCSRRCLILTNPGAGNQTGSGTSATTPSLELMPSTE